MKGSMGLGNVGEPYEIVQKIRGFLGPSLGMLILSCLKAARK